MTKNWIKKFVALALSVILTTQLLPLSIVAFGEQSLQPAISKQLAGVPAGYTGVYTMQDLNAVRNNLGGKYIMMNDIVFTDSDFAAGGNFYHDGQGWQPIGTLEQPFTGIFDGNGYEISGLKVNNKTVNSEKEQYVGLFGYNGGTIQKVGIANSNISFNYSVVSAGFIYAGGIAGINNGSIEHCYNRAVINEGFVENASVGYGPNALIIHAGGICGKNNSVIKECQNFGAVNGNTAGGIAGFSYSYSEIMLCANSGIIKSLAVCTEGGGGPDYTYNGLNSQSGGIVGLGFDVGIFDCYNSGEIVATANVEHVSTGTGEYEYFIYASGILGVGNGRISQCYNMGNVSASATELNEDVYLYDAGIATVYIQDLETEDCYYVDTAPLGVVVSSIGTHVGSATQCTSEQMQEPSTFIGFDFFQVWTFTNDGDYKYPVLLYTTKYLCQIEVDVLCMSFIQGEEFKKENLKVTAMYSDGTIEQVTDYEVIGFDKNELWQQLVTISYGQLSQYIYVYVVEKIDPATVELKSDPSPAVFNSLWVGDGIWFYGEKDGEILYNIDYDYEIISGGNILSISEDQYPYSILFNKPGSATVTVTMRQSDFPEILKQSTYNFVVSEKPNPVNISSPKDVNIKIGDEMPVITAANTNYRMEYYLDIGDMYQNFSWAHSGGGGGEIYGDLREWSNKKDREMYYYAMSDGEFQLKLFQSDYDSASEEPPLVLDTINVTIGEPAINVNIPQVGIVGQSIDLSTALINTALQSLNVEAFKNLVDIPWEENNDKLLHMFNYEPSIEILEGNDLIERSNDNYSNTLQSSETFKFIKSGTLKVKVKYSLLYNTLHDRTQSGDCFYSAKDYETVVTIPIKALSGIQVTTNPNKTSYIESTLLDTTGMELTLTYDDQTTEKITTGWTEEYDFSTPGTKTVIITYGGKTATFNATVVAKTITHISIGNLPAKMTYFTGETLDTTGLLITLHYNDQTTKNVSSGWSVQYDFSAPGDKLVTVSYGGKTTTFKVTVKSRVPDALNSNANKVDNNAGVIRKINENTTVSGLIANLGGGVFIKIFKGKNVASDSEKVGTGMVVKIMDGNTVKKEYILVVTGDTNGDGVISITDMVAVKSVLLGKQAMTGAYAQAADTNGDGKISITDFIQLKSNMLGKDKIIAR